VMAYSTVPFLLSVFFILPLVFFTFGRYFFSLNPPPWLIKPVSYYLFIGLGSLVLGWTGALMYVGVKTLLGCGWKAAAGIVSGVAAFLLGTVFLVRLFLFAGSGG